MISKDYTKGVPLGLYKDCQECFGGLTALMLKLLGISRQAGALDCGREVPT